MRIWTDRQGRTWEIELTLGFVRGPLAKQGVDLLHGDDANWAPLIDPAQMSIDLIRAIVWALIAPQAAEFPLSRETWEDQLTPDDEAFLTAALWGEIGDFFRSRPTSRLRWSALLEHHARTEAERLLALAPAASGLHGTPGMMSSALPESSAATGDPSPFGNSWSDTTPGRSTAGTVAAGSSPDSMPSAECWPPPAA